MNKPPQLISSPAELMDWFRANTEEGTRIYEKGMGIRCIPITGRLMRDVEPYELADLWTQISEQLPDDAIFMQWADERFVVQRAGTDRYYDEYQLLLASKAWTGPEDGGIIPLMRITKDAEGRITLGDPE